MPCMPRSIQLLVQLCSASSQLSASSLLEYADELIEAGGGGSGGELNYIVVQRITLVDPYTRFYEFDMLGTGTANHRHCPKPTTRHRFTKVS
jgi:hypothetical protein